METNKIDMEKLLTSYLSKVLFANEPVVINMESIPKEAHESAEVLMQFCNAVIEMKTSATHLAEGNFECEINGRNPLNGPLKELQAGLRHFLWQSKQIAKGDFQYPAEFLGDFSNSFNDMKEQLLQHRQLIEEKHQLELLVAEQTQAVLKERLETSKLYYHFISQTNDKIRRFRHDCKNHYICLDALLQQGNLEDSKAYLNIMTEVFNEATVMIHTDNYVLDTLLSEKIHLAMQENIVVEHQLSVAAHLNVSDFDWCILIGNAMDNAIEACLTLLEKEKRLIQIKAVSVKNSVSITIRNTAHPPLYSNANDRLTSKVNKEDHGFGLGNIQAIVEKYDGVIQTNYDQGYFTLNFMLCNI